MNNKCRKWISILSIMMCAVLLMGCTASKTSGTETGSIVMEKEESKAVSPSFIGGKDVMPIGGYIGPYQQAYSQDGDSFPDYITDEVYQLIADSGINLIVYSFTDYASAPAVVKQNLELCEKYGIGFFVTDSNVTGKTEQDEITVEEVAKEIVNYSDYASFCGMYLVDEPQASYYSVGDGTRLMPKYEKLANVLHNELDILTYANLLPITDIAKAEEYERYVEDFCETFQPKVLMWDYYPFDKYRNGDMSIYFYNMDLIRTNAQENNIPFWAYVQAGAQWNDSYEYFDSETPYYPNEYQFNWNVNTSLAMGAQGIQYFPLIQPYQFSLALTNNWDFERNGILGAMANKTQWYYYAQTINKHIAEIDEVLMNSVSKGVIVSGEQAKADMSRTKNSVIESGTFNQLQSVSGDAMVGCFNYNGKTALYVVNYSYEYAQNIALSFSSSQNIKMIQSAETSYVKGNSLTLDMAAGEGILLVLE